MILYPALCKNFTINYIKHGNDKIVIDLEEFDFVIKFPLYSKKDTLHNACETEIIVYEIAKRKNVEKFYVPLNKIFIKNDIYLYTQKWVITLDKIFLLKEKIIYSYDFLIKNYENKITKKVLNHEYFLFWFYYVIEKYNNEDIKNFLHFFTLPRFH